MTGAERESVLQPNFFCKISAPSPALRINAPIFPEPVSYTHLDVYKRQSVHCSIRTEARRTGIIPLKPAIRFLCLQIRRQKVILNWAGRRFRNLLMRADMSVNFAALPWDFPGRLQRIRAVSYTHLAYHACARFFHGRANFDE